MRVQQLTSRSMKTRLLAALALWVLASCAALRDDMRRAELAFEEARYEDVEVWLDDLEPSVADMDALLRPRFYYLRGMTAYRLGQRTAARHNLALCREEAGLDMSSLPAEWRNNLRSAMNDLGAPPLKAQEKQATSGGESPVAPSSPLPPGHG
jgi:hypothetical protein